MSTEIEILKKELQAAEEYRQRLQFLEQASFEAITVYDEALKCIDTNDTTTALFQYSRDEILGMSGMDFFAPEWRGRIPAIVKSAYNKAYEARMQRKDGTQFWGLIQGTTMALGDKKIRVSTCRDITDSRDIKEKLASSVEEFEAIFRNTQMGILLLDEDRKIRRVNDKLAHVLGYENAEEMTGQSIRIIHLSDKSYEMFSEFYRNNFMKSEVVKVDHQFKMKNGETIWLSISGAVIDKNHPPDLNKGIVWVLDDISDRKKAEFELAERSSRLTRLNEELVSLNLELQRVNLNKDKFISILAHDLKSPLGSVYGYTNLLHKDLDDLDITEIKERLSIINSSLGKTYSLLEEVLHWIRSQKGEITINIRNLSCYSLSKDVIEQIKPLSSEKDIKIHLKGDSELKALTDEDMFKTVLRNFLTNAIKFSRPGGEVQVQLMREQKKARVSVIDNGVGIKKEDIYKLWDISQAYSTPGTANEKGTGMGLKLSRELVEKMNGEIKIESEYKKGSSFSFTLPLNN